MGKGEWGGPMFPVGRVSDPEGEGPVRVGSMCCGCVRYLSWLQPLSGLCHRERVILGIWRSASGCVSLCVFTALPSPLLGEPRWTLGLKPAAPNPKELKSSPCSPVEPERTLEEVVCTVYQDSEKKALRPRTYCSATFF